MDNDLYEEQQVPYGVLTGINFSVSTQADKEKISVLTVAAANEVTDPRLGLPNPSLQCSTCGAKDLKFCEGHFGVIKFPFTILHPYYLSEITKILNGICPACKATKKNLRVKGSNSNSIHHLPKGCKYCIGKSYDWYPPMTFKVSSKDIFRKTVIVVETSDRRPKKFQRSFTLPVDYWDFIPKDVHQKDIDLHPYKRVLSHAQVRYLLNDVDPMFIKKFVPRTDMLFLNHFPVTPNRHRVIEVTHAFSNGQRLNFDIRTRFYKKLVDFRGIANELSSRVLDCLKISKLSSDSTASKESVYTQQKIKDSAFHSAGLRWIKDVVLGKRNNHSFRMVVVGDPNIKLSEIGIPCHIAETMEISEHLNRWNWEDLNTCCELQLLQKGYIYIRRKGNLVQVRRIEELEIGDTIHRPLCDGDLLLINRPPSIHQHSLIALSVKVLPVSSVVCINPLCCSPFRGDFDGDCFHGYIPQSVDARVELNELVALDKQLINGQSGRNLLSLSQDSLLAVRLVMEDGVLLNRYQMQQLEMFCPYKSISPAIVKAPLQANFWTGKQLFSTLLPQDFDYEFPSNDVYISNGELMSSSEGTSWLRDTDDNLFQSIVRRCPDKVLDFLHYTQEVLCEWLSMTGFSVSLSDLYLTSDECSHKNMIDEIYCGLQEAEQRCNFRQMLVDSCQDFLVASSEGNQDAMAFDVERLCYEKQKSAALSQASVDAFKQIFRDIQNLVYRYANQENSLLAMFKAGSKGNLLKLVQHSMCLGLQHSLVPLSFRIPHQLSCSAWNNHKAQDSPGCTKYIPYAVVQNSFLMGLNPLECFVHSITSRDSSFSDNADLPGTMTRKLMFFMRDLYYAYDGTVRSSYGNQLISFSYKTDQNSSMLSDSTNDFLGNNFDACRVMGGEPVGSLSACAISEAAYSALDQPISLLETSPLLNLKDALECGLKRKADQTLSLFLSKKLEKRRHGFEYAALEVQNHLEKLVFSDIVSTVMITFSPQTRSNMHFSPWVCHFHVYKEIVRKRRLKVHSIIDSLYEQCIAAKQELKIHLPKFQITSKECSVDGMTEEDSDTFCITVASEKPKNGSIELNMIQKLVIPILLGTIIKGFPEIKKVDILWKDRPDVSKSRGNSSGELYLRVLMSGDCNRTRLWSMLVDNCLHVMDMIDWTRSHPDNINDFCVAYGIDAGWKYFLTNLESAVSDTGKTILREHLVLVANCLSVTGSFIGLNARGMARQKAYASSSSPFARACFSAPGDCFIKAAKAGLTDKLEGSLDALAWGKIPSTGTGGHFDIIYSGKDHELSKPVDVYSLLGSKIIPDKQNVKSELQNARNQISDKNGGPYAYTFGGSMPKGLKNFETISKSLLRHHLTFDDIQRLSRKLKSILHDKYSINERLSEVDKSILMMALYFHPHRDAKIGTGVEEIKVGSHPKHQDSSCFILKRTDGTFEDFSYHKCVIGALEIIAPKRAKNYQSKWLRHDNV